MGIQIHQLNALSRAPQTGDVLAIDTGTDTAKIDYNALATAIINKLGGDPVTIAHGGTGATTADGACGNIGAVKKSGDTMTGTLAIKSADGVWSTIDLVSQSGFCTGQVAANHLSNFIIFREISPSGKLEFYRLPDADNTQDDTVYSILTGKTPVTVAQGGTGANGAAGARANLGAGCPSGTFTTVDGKTITVTNGFITSIQ